MIDACYFSYPRTYFYTTPFPAILSCSVESQTFRNERELEEYLSLPCILPSSLLPTNVTNQHLSPLNIYPTFALMALVKFTISRWPSDSLGFIVVMAVIFVEYLLVATCYLLNILHVII